MQGMRLVMAAQSMHSEAKSLTWFFSTLCVNLDVRRLLCITAWLRWHVGACRARRRLHARLAAAPAPALCVAGAPPLPGRLRGPPPGFRCPWTTPHPWTACGTPKPSASCQGWLR